MSVLDEIQKIGLVPVIKLDDSEAAAPLAKALKAGGVPVAEITFRTDAAEESIRRIAREPETSWWARARC
jgi:2-dehydro-3-deoxyphosphogluconate aldolase/(4S)-4-hydroxy-2-oxoglutarate aldolase